VHQFEIALDALDFERLMGFLPKPPRLSTGD
jgi:hypothetical protein